MTTTPSFEALLADLQQTAEVEPQIATLTAWRDHLIAWRQILCDQLLALPRHDAGEQGLRLSIVRIDFGLDGIDDTLLPSSIPLDELMRAAGYVPRGPAWLGTLPETERKLRELTQRRDECALSLQVPTSVTVR